MAPQPTTDRKTFTVHKRAAEFLAQFPPFNMMDTQDVLSLCFRLQAHYYEPNSTVYTEDSTPAHELYVVRYGVIHLETHHLEANRSETAQETTAAILMDVREEGDVFGISAQMSGKPHVVTARVQEEALLYVIPWEDFFPMMERYPKAALFLASGLASSVQMLHSASMMRQSGANEQKSGSPFGETDIITLSASRTLISSLASDSIQIVAELMACEGIGSMIITSQDRLPIGIITDTDFRKKVATGKHRITEPVSSIMNAPVITAKEGLSAAQALMTMMRHNIRHICLTEDGTPNSGALGVISQHDILLKHGNNPALLVKEIVQSRSIDHVPTLRDRAERLATDYIQQEVSVKFVGEMLSHINDALVVRALRDAEERLQADGWTKPDVAYCWIAFGSEGRREQLLRTDQDNALIYEDVPETADESTHTHAREYFAALAAHTSDILVKCGFALCPGNMMATNPAWCQPLATWKTYFKNWICQPEPSMLLNASIFFDMRPVAGNVGLATALRQMIDTTIAQERVFLRFMAHNALEHPPLMSFFRNFVVEKSGEHKDTFDIKTRAIAPLTDAARVLALDVGCHELTNTAERFERVAELHPAYQKLCSNAATAYQMLLRFRAVNGLQTGTSGQFLRPGDVNKVERQMIRTAFDTIAEVQKVLRVRYHLDSM
jgi:CBS domain-containing protein